MNLPPPKIERVGRFYVVRDDLISGGTKTRYILPYLATVPEQEVVYASPACGYAQIALAHACRTLGKRAVIFTAKRNTPHPRTREAQAAGATIVQVPYGYLKVVQARARAYAQDRGARLIPFGVDIPEATQHFITAAKGIPITPSEVWSCAGSGVLIRALQRVWPQAAFHAVRVGAEPNIGAAKLWAAPEKFEEPAKFPPPFPSCANYDAKVWRFASKYAKEGALLWNVAA